MDQQAYSLHNETQHNCAQLSMRAHSSAQVCPAYGYSITQCGAFTALHKQALDSWGADKQLCICQTQDQPFISVQAEKGGMLWLALQHTNMSTDACCMLY